MVNPKFVDAKSVLLVDGNNLLMRILFSQNSGNVVKTTSEIIENCAQIFLHQVILCVKKYSCNRAYVAFDCGGSIRKKSIFEEYKGNRQVQSSTSPLSQGTSDPNLQLFSDLKEATIKLCRIFNIPVFMEFGIEADDFVGIATEELLKFGNQIVILSNDSDFLQLTSNSKVVCSIPYKKTDVDKTNFTEYFSNCSKSKGVNIISSEYLFYKAVVGDATDNIDGIKGIGYKTLNKLMEECLKTSSNEEKLLYLTNGLSFLDRLAEKNTTKLEKAIHENLDKLKRNYKLIELSSKYISPNAIHLTIRKLMEINTLPNRKEILSEYRQFFGNAAPIEFVINALFSLKSIYQSADNIS